MVTQEKDSYLTFSDDNQDYSQYKYTVFGDFDSINALSLIISKYHALKKFVAEHIKE
jgi:hypothetical protein